MGRVRMAGVDVVTLSRQLGSGGDEVATQLAQRLGWRWMDRDIIERAARASGAPEAALAALDELNLLDLRPSAKARKSHRRSVERVVREAAEEGRVIIIGRAGHIILRDHPSAIHVKVVSPPETRVQRVMADGGIDESAALNRIVASDQSRATYIRQEYGADWLNPLHYDLIVNVRGNETAWAADLILAAVQSKT